MRTPFFALALALAVLAGCSPRLAGDGHYGCETGPCPAERPFCYPPEPGLPCACHARPPMGGTPTCGGGGDAGPRIDGGGRADGGILYDYGPCRAEGCPGDAVCVGDPATGFCAPPCGSGEGCVAYAGLDSACDGTSCRRGCDDTHPCPAGMACVSGRWEEGERTVCTEIALATPTQLYDACASDAPCPMPLECINGACVRPCEMTGPNTCLEGEVCQNGPPPAGSAPEGACLVPCTMASPGVCPAETACRPAGMMSTTYRCIPSAWPAPT